MWCPIVCAKRYTLLGAFSKAARHDPKTLEASTWSDKIEACAKHCGEKVKHNNTWIGYNYFTISQNNRCACDFNPQMVQIGPKKINCWDEDMKDCVLSFETGLPDPTTWNVDSATVKVDSSWRTPYVSGDDIIRNATEREWPLHGPRYKHFALINHPDHRVYADLVVRNKESRMARTKPRRMSAHKNKFKPDSQCDNTTTDGVRK